MKRWFIVLVIMILFSTLLIGGCKKKKSSHSEEPPPQTKLPSPEWHSSTPAGIKVGANNSTIAQYEQRWSKKWSDIEWSKLDELFEYYKQYYCIQLGWDCKGSSPSQLSVYIMPWDSRCKDAETPEWPYEIYAYLQGHGWICVDGWFPYQSEGLVMYMHLGDDPGVSWSRYRDDGALEEFYAFEVSAYPHELYHFFQAVSGRPVTDSSPTNECGVSIAPLPDDIVIHCPEVEKEER